MRTVRHCLLLPALASAALCAMQARAQMIVFPSPLSGSEQSLTTTVSTRFLPGEFRERQLASESNLQLRPWLLWHTTTGLSGARYDQAAQFRNQSARLTTGPELRWGSIELAMPLQAGRELLVASGESQWASGMPRMTVQLGPNDSVKLEARATTRQDSAATRISKSKKAVALSWRHTFNEKFALRTGLERSSETVEHSLETSESAQAFAQLSASLPSNWRLVLGGALYQAINRSGADEASRDRSQTLSLSANRALVSGWKLSGSLSVRQAQNGDESSGFTSRSGSLRLSRDF